MRDKAVVFHSNHVGLEIMSNIIDFTYATADLSCFRRGFVRVVEAMSGQKRLRQLYEDYMNDIERPDFFDTAVERLELDVVFDRDKLERVPANGPVLFLANHPYGVADGVIFTWLTRQVRSDVKVMANQVLCQAPEAANHLLPVDFSETRKAMLTNVETRRAALEILKHGGAIGVFPAGGVAASEKPLRGPAVDPRWHSFVVKLVRQSGATVVPFHFDGQNSRLFQIASHTSYTLRLALFFRETRRLMGKKIAVNIGEPINPDTLAAFSNKRELLRFLRARTYALASPSQCKTRGIDNLWEREFTYPSRFKF